MSRPMAACVIALAIAGSVAIPRGAADGGPPLRVLFVGNSYTRFNDLPRVVRRISESVPDAREVWASRATGPGFSLRRHWERPRLRARIADEGYDAVVLQGRSLGPIEAPDELREYAGRLAAHAHAHGSGVVLFETWARHPDHFLYRRSRELDGPAQMTERIEEVYLDLGQRLRAPVAPVGRVWDAARRELPATSLHRPDGTHPSMAGTYLAACVLYATLTGRDPREATYRPHPLGRRRAARIRELAARALVTGAAGSLAPP